MCASLLFSSIIRTKFHELRFKRLIFLLYAHTKMEANEERREVVEKKEDSETQGKKKNDGVDESAATKKSTTGLDPMTKTLIHKSIITDGNGGKEGGTGDYHGAETRDDVLAFSRSVHKIDSSLE